MLGRIRGWFDGSGWYLAGAGALFVVALLAALLSLQADNLLWTGRLVTGTEQHGIVYYTWQGQSYTVDNVGSSGSAAHVNVYLNPADPASAVVDNPAHRLITDFMVGVPALAGIVLVVIGGTRNYRWKRRNARKGTGDWWMSRIPR